MVDKQAFLFTSGEVKNNSQAMFSYGLLLMDTPVLADL